MTHSDTRFQAAPVSAVNSDQASTTWVNIQRTPSLSPKKPMGISNRA
jgi:hypothetical protein